MFQIKYLIYWSIYVCLQIILAQDTNIVNSESSQVIVDQARYNAEGVQRTAHVQNFIERNSDNFHAVRQVGFLYLYKLCLSIRKLS